MKNWGGAPFNRLNITNFGFFNNYQLCFAVFSYVVNKFMYSVSCDLSAISVGTGTDRHRPAPTGTDRHRPAQTGTVPIATGTDRHKIARDEFY